jgi:hypothetical protein
MRFGLCPRVGVLLHKSKGLRQRDRAVLLLKRLHNVIRKVAYLMKSLSSGSSLTPVAVKMMRPLPCRM